MSDIEDKVFAVVKWRISDVLSLKPTWTEEQALEFLDKNGPTIADMMIMRGWDVISSLLPVGPEDQKDQDG